MNLKTTRVYEENAAAYASGKRRALNEGGTAASKTYSILQLLVVIAAYMKGPFLISVVSESMPHLKRGAIRDFFNIIGEAQDNNPRWNKTDKFYRFRYATIEFFPADDSSKLRGGRRNILFINEANNITYDSYRELEVRTTNFIFMDWNPVGEFWAHENLMGQPENAYIHSTYLDALEVVAPEVITNIESNRDRDPNWWNVYGLGLMGKIEGIVYPLFSQVEALPPGDYFYGLDFGFSDDPAVLVKCVIHEDSLYCQELIYERGLTNPDIAVRMEELGVEKHKDPIFADAAEPKSIQEIYEHGFNIYPAPKGEGSVEFGHQKVRQYRQSWTKDSLSCIKEQRNFRYMPDKNGKFTEKTTHLYSHGMDARRYGLVGFLAEPPFLIG